MCRRPARTHRPGFTLLELLVVMAIVGLAWFSILPNLDIAGRMQGESRASLNDFLSRVRSKAVNEYSREAVTLEIGKPELKWGAETFTLASPVQRAAINEQSPLGTEIVFYVYPAGVTDAVELELLSGETLIAAPLQAAF